MWTVPAALEAADEEVGGFTFVRDDGTERHWSLGRLSRRAREVAAALRERGLADGERVALALPEPEQLVPALLGVMRAGGVPVPLRPPTGRGPLDTYLADARQVVAAASASYLVAACDGVGTLAPLAAHSPLREIVSVGLLDGDPERAPAPPDDVDAVALVHLALGAAAPARAAALTHRAVAARCRAIALDGLGARDGDRAVSWLPLWHDVGLTGFVLAPILHRLPVTLLPTRAFVRDPTIWLRTIARHRGTITFGPDFAYGLAARSALAGDPAGLDLSCLRVAGCGSAPIQSEPLREFGRRFAAAGFRAEAFRPAYALADPGALARFVASCLEPRPVEPPAPPARFVRPRAPWGGGPLEVRAAS